MAITEVAIQELVALLDAERQAWIEGRFDPHPSGPLVQADDMTIFGPFGGDAGAGGPNLAALQRRANSAFAGGSGNCELVRAFTAGDTVVLVMLERNQVTFAARPDPQPWNLRTTQIFRRDADRWVRLHRHADPLLELRSLEETLSLLRRGEALDSGRG